MVEVLARAAEGSDGRGRISVELDEGVAELDEVRDAEDSGGGAGKFDFLDFAPPRRERRVVFFLTEAVTDAAALKRANLALELFVGRGVFGEDEVAVGEVLGDDAPADVGRLEVADAAKDVVPVGGPEADEREEDIGEVG